MANKDNFGAIQQSVLYPQESALATQKDKQFLLIGLPKETSLQENRICLTPGSVGVLVANGHEIVIETGAGDAANFPDYLYSENGAKIVYSAKEAFECDIVLKVEPPKAEEVVYMAQKSTLMSAIQLSCMDAKVIKAISQKKITAIGYEYIEDNEGQNPIVRSMSEIASNCIISIAGEYLSSTKDGMGIIFGGTTGVPPTKVVILGAGTVGEQVARVANALGAEVRVFDNHHYRLRRLQKDLGRSVFTSIIDANTLSRELKQADVVIGALRSDSGQICVVSDEMVAEMRKKAVIIDASITEGGCFETSSLTSHDKPTFIKYDVIHYCVPNIASRAPRTASKALSYILTPMLNQIGRYGGIEEMIVVKEWFMKGVYSYKGFITNEHIADKTELKYRDIVLLLAVR